MDDIFQQLSNFQFELLQSFGGLGKIARGICAIASVLYIGIKVGRWLANAEPIRFMELSFPFVIFLFLVFFPSFRLLIDGILSPISGATSSYQASAEADYDKLMFQIQAEAKKLNNQDPSSTAGNDVSMFDWGKGLYEYFKIVFSKLGIFWFVFNIIFALLQAVLKGAIFIMLLMRAINLAILIIFGPISWALSIFPEFKDSYKQWIANYINIYMWYPILNIIEGITYRANIIAVTKAKTLYVSMFIDDITIATADMKPDDFYSGMSIALGMGLAAIFAVFQVPQIANMVVQAASGGMSQAPTPGYHATKAILTSPMSIGRNAMTAVSTFGSTIISPVAKAGVGGGIMAGRAIRNRFKGNSKTSD